MNTIDYSVSSNSISAGKLSEFLKDGIVGDKTIISDANKLAEIKTTILMQKLFFGDIGFAEKILLPLLSLTDCTSVMDAATKKTCNISTDKIRDKKIKESLSGYQDLLSSNSISNIPPAISSPKAKAKTILYGIKAENINNSRVSCGDGYCNLIDDYLVYIDMTTNTGNADKSDMSTKMLLNIPGNTASSDLKIEWNGAVVESFKSIKYFVKQSSGLEGNIGFYSDQPISSSEQGNIPIVIPGAKKYIEIISQIEKTSKAETAFSASLKELLAKYNAYLFSKSFFDNILGRIKVQITDDKTSGIDARAFKEIKDSFVESKKAITKEFDTVVQETNNFKDIIEIFEKIDANSRQNNANILR